MGHLGAADNLGDATPQVNKRETILGLCITFAVLAWICVAFRLFVRLRLIRSPGWDDLFVVLSLGKLLTLLSTSSATDHGLGEHFLLLGMDQASAFLRSFYVFNGSYAMSTALIKISLLLQYMRLYRPGSLLHNICRGLVVFVALWGVAYSVIAWVPCVPPSDYWGFVPSMDISHLRCYGYGSQYVKTFAATYESHAAVNLALDLAVMGLPIPLYFEPGAHGRTKMGLFGIIIMGTIVNIFSVWRLAETVHHQAGTHPTFDPTWYGAIVIVMAGLETASACICASIPVFWGPMLASASQLLGQIFVTKEVHVTTEHRFANLSSGESADTFPHLEMHGATMGLPALTGSADEFGLRTGSRAGSRLEWHGKDGAQHQYQTWSV
ncbi:hypothetical protein C8A03DRAFT_17477 [Achaetomium macrosporum]|uniref:Rhodopsin domain-containing protein n=1 Tax=Achaetomium macrosporum TaxID=79813 RepID=A0AAN7H9Y2_9PEZI|nr:hypothetical protein C8A03DRAFT_17477 [Achaetomium macrosporum]